MTPDQLVPSIKSRIHSVLDVAARIFGVSVADITGARRLQNVADARAIAITFLLDNGIHRLPIMAEIKRDHSTLYKARERSHRDPFMRTRLRMLTGIMREAGWE